MQTAAQIWRCCGCGVARSCSSDSTPGLGTSICHRCGPKSNKYVNKYRKKERKKERERERKKEREKERKADGGDSSTSLCPPSARPAHNRAPSSEPGVPGIHGPRQGQETSHLMSCYRRSLGTMTTSTLTAQLLLFQKCSFFHTTSRDI